MSSWNGKCIDVPGSRFEDGNRLQMWDCNGTGAQTFFSDDVQFVGFAGRNPFSLGQRNQHPS